MPPSLLTVTVTIALFAFTTFAIGAESDSKPANDAREISVDVNQVKGPLNRAFRFSVGSDRAIIHLRPEHQRDLRFVKKTCGFEYMRFHGLLNEEMKIVKLGAGRIDHL